MALACKIILHAFDKLQPSKEIDARVSRVLSIYDNLISRVDVSSFSFDEKVDSRECVTRPSTAESDVRHSSSSSSSGFEVDLGCHRVAIREASYANNHKLVFQIIERMKAQHIRPCSDCLGYIFKLDGSYQPETVWNLYEDSLKDTSEFVLDPKCYSDLVKFCGSAGFCDRIVDLYFALHAVGLLDCRICACAIKALADNKRYSLAVAIAEEMTSLNIQHNHYSFTCVIKACTDAGLFTRALQFVQQMRSEGVSPNSYADAAAKAYLRAGEVEDVTTVVASEVKELARQTRAATTASCPRFRVAAQRPEPPDALKRRDRR